jgi:tRNA(fMet)-specific endonuclease VapC
MSFLLDTDTCSAHLKWPSGLMHRFVQHSGGLYIPTIVLGELYTWAHQRKNPSPVIQRIENDLLTDVKVLDFDADCAKEFGRIRGQLLQQGISVSRIDLLIASVALVHNLTLVTHNTS